MENNAAKVPSTRHLLLQIDERNQSRLPDKKPFAPPLINHPTY